MGIRTLVRRLFNGDSGPVGVRITVLLTMGVAFLSILTGIANIGAQSVVGPLAEFVPPLIQRTAGFTGTLTGFLMIASAFGLRKHLRAAWYSTATLLPLTALQGLLQSSALSVPLVVLSLLAMPNIVYNRRHFTRSIRLSTAQMSALVAIVGTQIYGTVGTYALREEFANVNTMLDAFYFTLVTASTVGYGDAVPTTQSARLFGMSVLVLGTASFALALGTLLGPVLEARFARVLGRMTHDSFESFQDHVLVLGDGDLTEVIIEELGAEVNFVVVTPNRERVLWLTERDVDVLTGDPGDEETLRRSGILSARAAIAATNNDAEDAMAVLTARDLNPELLIVAAATNRQNVQKLKRAGADHVLSPAAIGARILVRSAFDTARTEPSIDWTIGVADGSQNDARGP